MLGLWKTIVKQLKRAFSGTTWLWLNVYWGCNDIGMLLTVSPTLIVCMRKKNETGDC